jgi:hypothetical protein
MIDSSAVRDWSIAHLRMALSIWPTSVAHGMSSAP